MNKKAAARKSCGNFSDLYRHLAAKIGRRLKPPAYMDIFISMFLWQTRRPTPAARDVGLAQFGDAPPLQNMKVKIECDTTTCRYWIGST